MILSDKKILVVSDDIIFNDKRNFISSSSLDFDFWNKYNIVFNNTTYLLRCHKVLEKDRDNFLKLDKSNEINFDCILSNSNVLCRFLTLGKFFLRSFTLNKSKIIIVRFPSLYGMAFVLGLMLRRISYNLEVVADAELAYTSIKPIQKILYFIQRFVIYKADEVAYVTENYLQNKFQSARLYNYNYSSTTIGSDFFSRKPQIRAKYSLNSRTLMILNVSGHIKNKQKGHDTIIDIAKHLRTKGLIFKITLVGEGKYISKIIKIINLNNLSAYFDVKGYLYKTQIISLYRESDIFLYTSKSEGLPRVIIEAMANSLLCISTNAGGISELIDQNLIFDFNDSKGMANKIMEFANFPSQMTYYEKKNYNRAKKYLPINLESKRRQFFEKLLTNSQVR